MAFYILKRVLLLIVTLFVIMTFVYFVTSFVMLRRFEPRDPFWTDVATIWRRYLEYLRLIFTQWYFGTDREGEDVWEVLKTLMWRTLRLNIVAFFFYTVFGMFLGLMAALYHKRIPDKIIQFIILVFSSIPPYVLIVVLIIIFAFRVPVLPSQMPALTRPLGERLPGFILPVVVTSALPLANIARVIRGELRDRMVGDHLLLLKVKGLKRHQVVSRHLLKDGAVSMMPELPMAILYALVSSFIVEIIYGVRGVSAWFFRNIFRPFMGIHFVSIEVEPTVLVVMFYCLITLGATVIIDITYRFLDPRMSVISDGKQQEIH